MMEPALNLFALRISEARVAAVLTSIANPPGKRTRPHPEDASGDFDFWFDGGACKHHTGSAHYHFTDGTIAIVASPAIRLWVRIQFPEGEEATLCQANHSN